MDKLLRPSILKRILAFVLDTMALGFMGFLSGLFLEDFYVSLGKYGTLLGSGIVLLYFTLFNSKINHGQTLGKMAIDAKVTDLKGNYLTLEKSFLRAFIFIFPVMNVELFSAGKGMIVILVLTLILMFASIYFISVNQSRRTLHDILFSTVVTYQHVDKLELVEENDRSKKKLIPLIGLAALIVGMGIYQASFQNNLGQLLAAKEKIEKLEGVLTVNELKLNTTYTTNSEPYSFVSLTVRIDDKKQA